MIRALLTTACLLTLSSVPLFGGGEGWVQDFDAAAAKAKAEGKDMLVDFTGSDWCGWCVKLDKEVFSHESWREAAMESYVLVSLDFPRGEAALAKVPNPKRNQEVKGQFAISQFPTVLLMTADGLEFGRTGYQAGGPEAYLKHMAELEAKGKAKLERVQRQVDAYLESEGAERERALASILQVLTKGRSDAAGRGLLVRTVRASLAGELPKATRLQILGALLEAGEYDQELFDAALAADPENQAGVYERAMEAMVDQVGDKDQVQVAMPRIASFHALGKHSDSDRAAYVLALGAYWAQNVVKDKPLAKTYAQRVMDLGHSDPKVLQIVERILKG